MLMYRHESPGHPCRELRRVSPDIKITTDQIRTSLTSEVLKREVVEWDKAVDARKVVAKATTKALRVVANKEASES